MDLDNPGVLLSGLIISSIGFGVFLYGKKQAQPKCLAVGFGLMALPLVAHSMLFIWGGMAAGLLGLKLMPSA